MMSKLIIVYLAIGIVYCNAKIISDSSSNELQTEGNTKANCLTVHNAYRAKHGSPNLEYDSKLEKVAIERANVLAKNDNGLKHDKANQNGENLYGISTSGDSRKLYEKDLCKMAVDSWYSEVKNYDYDNPKYAQNTGHFTQVIWKSTTKLGCAKSISKSKKIFVVCNYAKERGNMQGAFEKNVLPPQ